jgi:hypothetical protein
MRGGNYVYRELVTSGKEAPMTFFNVVSWSLSQQNIKNVHRTLVSITGALAET